MSVNYDKTIGGVVTPPTAATQGDQPASDTYLVLVLVVACSF